MSIVISLGNWADESTHESRDGSTGQIIRKGFAVQWARSIDPRVLFALHLHLRIQGVEVEQSMIVRENVNA